MGTVWRSASENFSLFPKIDINQQPPMPLTPSASPATALFAVVRWMLLLGRRT